ncbi:MFS transporter [Rhizobium sp. S163]|uniref:MFS transporter n=1 Tax=Rhizobium sp. S163 TaxID=3055039 RepID=UPI0025A951F3|nr:MFS transporter [Rhizobium sp. S163]MDM9649316.1 MFS transporter [Rhizobium sp. S163]
MHQDISTDRTYRHVVVMTAALFLSYLTVAMSLPAVPVRVVRDLGLGNAWAGLVVGIAFLSTILTRGYAGAYADRLGGKVAMQRGLLVYSAAALICGRLVLGLGESIAMVGMISWAIGLMGPARSGAVISLVGIGMYGAFAAGGPLGLLLLDRIGFESLMAVSMALPLLGLAVIQALPAVEPQAGHREPFWRIIGKIWRPGAAVALQGVGFAGLGAFFSLYFLSRGWPFAGLGLTFFGVGFVLMRLICGHLPDRFGGRNVALAALAAEACGQALLWIAPNPYLALVGALLTGLGCSLVFPSMGSEVVKQVPAHQRGTAMGGFAAFQDLAYGATGPIVGILADCTGYDSVFLVGGVCAVIGLAAVNSIGRHPNAA